MQKNLVVTDLTSMQVNGAVSDCKYFQYILRIDGKEYVNTICSLPRLKMLLDLKFKLPVEIVVKKR